MNHRTHTWKQDAAYELSGIEARIASNRRSAESTDKASTAAIADATLPSLQRRAAELRDLVKTLPERPSQWSSPSVQHTDTPRTTPLTEEELEALEIPAFLRRT